MQNLNSFMKFGYFLNYTNKNIPLTSFSGNQTDYKNLEDKHLIKIGAELWREAISSNFSLGKDHLVPISGGLDSRAILASLLEHTEGNNIHTYTFGTPNTYDYEIGNYIAKKCGTKHHTYNLEDYEFKQNELNEISKRIDFQTILFHHAPIYDVDQMYLGCQLWSGFIGDQLAGGRVSKSPSKTIDEAKKKFVKSNTYVKSIDLTKNFLVDDLISCTLQNQKISIDERLDIENRQLKYNAPHVLMKGYEYRTPFLYKPWIDLMLGIDDEKRLKKNLYKKILLGAFPIEFSYKTKSNAGLSFNSPQSLIFFKKIQNGILSKLNLSINKNINYLDFNKKIRSDEKLKLIITENIKDLSARDIIYWLDLEKILTRHLLGKSNYADALITLVSLEIHLKNGKKI